MWVSPAAFFTRPLSSAFQVVFQVQKKVYDVEIPIEPIVGPEFVTGSTRMKSGTAQKLILNMITTTLMIQLGRVKGNRMVNMELTNEKLIIRGTKMIVDELGYSETKARRLLVLHGSVQKVIDESKK